MVPIYLYHDGLTPFMVRSWFALLNMGGGALLGEHCLSSSRRQLTDTRVCKRERERERAREREREREQALFLGDQMNPKIGVIYPILL